LAIAELYAEDNPNSWKPLGGITSYNWWVIMCEHGILPYTGGLADQPDWWVNHDVPGFEAIYAGEHLILELEERQQQYQQVIKNR